MTWLVSLVFFRADNISIAVTFFKGLGKSAGTFDPRLAWCPIALLGTLAIQAIEYGIRGRGIAKTLRLVRDSLGGAAVVAIIFSALLFLKTGSDLGKASESLDTNSSDSSFIYFRF